MPARPAPPRPSRMLLRGFQWYLRKYLRKSFHTVGVAGEVPEVDETAPLIVYLNHASWWDPLVAMCLAERLHPGRTLYAPFDAEALSRYPVFEKLGFFGVDQESRRGAVQFLKTARAVLESPGGSLWMTPEGRFVDPRDEGVGFEPGLAHLVEHLSRAGEANPASPIVVPLAIEYSFWEERLPEALCRFGEPIVVSDHPGLDKSAWDALFVGRLRDTQSVLAQSSIGRDSAAFRTLLGGGAGVGGLYEPVRWAHAKLTGKAYRAAHSEKFGEG